MRVAALGGGSLAVALAANRGDGQQCLNVTLLASDVLVWAHTVAGRALHKAAGRFCVAIYNVQMRPTPFGLLPSKARWACQQSQRCW